MTYQSEKPRRVVVTGMAAVTPLGNTLDDFRAALDEGRGGITRAAETLPMDFVGEAASFTGSIDEFGELPKERQKAVRKALKLMCRETQMAVAAAQLAMSHAGFGEGGYDPERSGVVLGSDYMLTMPEDYTDGVRKCATDGSTFDYSKWGNVGLGQMTPLWMLKYLPNMPASHIAIFNDLRGPNNSLTMREASSVMAIGEAFHTIARGHADLMLCGATGTRILPMQAIHALQTDELATGGDPADACRPFDLTRNGTVAGEGAAVLVLEERESAVARGAHIFGEVLGQGSSLVASQKLAGRQQTAMANAMRAALGDANIAADAIGHINAHGLGTRASDADEAAAIVDVFADTADTIPVTAIKSYFGNLGAAGGTAEIIASLLAAQSEQSPATHSYAKADPACPLRIATKASPLASGASMLKLSATPQGQAAALVIGFGG